MIRYGRAWAWLTCLLSVACAQRDGTVVAEVGEYQIEGAALRGLVGKLLPGQRTTATGDDARRHYLQVLVDGRLMVLEAEGRGLHADEIVQKRIRDAVEKRLLRLYQKRDIPTGAPLSDEEIRDYFQREGFARERLCSGILAADRASAEVVVAELEAGRSFAEVAMDHSLDRRSAEQGGLLGYVGLTTIDRLHIPADLFRNLAVGEVSRPIPAGKGAWHLFRFSEERVATLSKHRPYIEGLLREERRLLAERQHLERLRESYNVRLSGIGLSEMIDAYRRRSPQELSTSRTALYVHDEGEITVSEADEALQMLNLRRAFADSAEAAYAVNSAVLRPFLMLRAAHEKGYSSTAEIVKLRRRNRFNVLAGRLRELEMAKTELSEQEIRSYYGEHPKMFRIEPSVTVEEILLATRTEAEAAKDRLASGEPFASLIAASRRPDAKRNDGEYHFHPQDEKVYPKLLAAIGTAAEGEWTGPVEVEHGFSVFRVTERVAERIQPYERVQQRARGLLMREREASTTNELIKALRDKFRAQVVVHERNLREALPDSLISG